MLHNISGKIAVAIFRVNVCWEFRPEDGNCSDRRNEKLSTFDAAHPRQSKLYRGVRREGRALCPVVVSAAGRPPRDCAKCEVCQQCEATLSSTVHSSLVDRLRSLFRYVCPAFPGR
jgi:hypothetical protein